MRRPANGWAFGTPKVKTSYDETDSTDAAAARYPQNQYDDQHPSENSDDEDYDDDEMPRRQRSRSFGDAEDILHSSYYHESFTMEPASKANLPAPGDDIHSKTKGLHHRNTGNNSGGSNSGNMGVHHRRYAPQTPRNLSQSPGGGGIGQYQTPTPKRKPLYPGLLPNSHHNPYQPWRRPNLLKGGLIFGFGCYFLLLINSSVYLWTSKEDQDRYQHRLSASTPMVGDVYGTTGPHWMMHAARGFAGGGGSRGASTWIQDRIMMERTSKAQIEDRAQKRRARTRPYRGSSNNSNDVAWYSIHRMDTRPPTLGPPLPPSSSLAAMDQLCGFTAQKASLNQPQHYPGETALDASARVLITGILNPLGFNLAMYLYNQCGVEVIGGVDPMFPNTVQNRLQLVEERLELLHTTIPKLAKPIGLSFVGLDPKLGDQTEEEYDYLAWKPTHVVHLAGYSPDIYSDGAVDPTWRNDRSPYVSSNRPSPLYPLRSSMVAMEQLLQSISQAPSSERPHFLYVSNVDNGPFFSATKLIDEVLAETYGVPSIALRLPNSLYGPWGQAGSIVHDLLEESVMHWSNQTNATSSSSSVSLASTKAEAGPLNMMHLDDALEAIVATMQYQTAHSIAVDIAAAGTPATSSALSNALQSLRPGMASPQSAFDDVLASPAKQLQGRSVTPHPALAEWKPRISLKQGLIQTMAWHLHRHAPYGPAPVETADEFLKRLGQPTCAATDWHCHKGKEFVPCASECNVRDQCVSSVFDEIQPLVQNVTEGCDIVLYTHSLGYNVEDLSLQAEYMDPTSLKDGEKLICNFAFVSRDSALVKSATQKVPTDQLANFGIQPQVADSSKDLRDRKLDGLNGRLLYRGWILIWIRDTIKPLKPADRSLLKLSPGNLFHKDVGRAVFMEENFSVSPKITDVFFLVAEMNRKPFPRRTVKKDVRYKSAYGKALVKRKKFRLPAEPRRRAAILFSPLRMPNKRKDSTVKHYKTGDKKLTVHDAAKFMRYELDLDDPDKEPPRARQQREFYEKVPSYINRNTELRSTEEPWYRYSMRHWIRSRWVVHDMHMEESRLLRCDWYQEHLQWGTELDQLSFAHVMAARELKRRIAHNEPDDHVKSFIEKHPHLKDLTDSYEWHPMETDANQLFREPVHWVSDVPEHVTVEDEAVAEEEEAAAAVVEEHHHEPTPLYVRIISERIMAASRQVWDKINKNTGKHDNNKKKKKKPKDKKKKK